MQLDENYFLENNENQWTLKYVNTYFDSKKNKEVTSRNDYFFYKLSDALNSYIDKKLKASETVSEAIQTLLNSLIELNKKGFSLNK